MKKRRGRRFSPYRRHLLPPPLPSLLPLLSERLYQLPLLLSEVIIIKTRVAVISSLHRPPLQLEIQDTSPCAMAPGTAVSASSKKRRFQVPITQYFSPSPSQQTESEPSSHFNYNAPTHSAHPSLPPTIQSSLLAVGMRVRKAVPEGYRTKLIAKANNHQSKTTPRDEHYTDSSISPAYTELIPFSGAFKVGNYGVQSFPQPSAAVTEPMTAARQLDEESLPFSSQESTQSFESSSSIPRPNSYKRGFEIEEDDEDFDGQDSFPSRIHPSHSRPILLPRSGRQRTLRSKASSPSSLLKGRSEQENWDLSFNFNNGGGGDFEDADFLKRREDVDEEYLRRAREVRMGGV